MKKIFSNIRTMAALLMAGAAFAACSSSDDIIENQQPANNGKQAYTLTINASKDGSTTRALDLVGSAVVASWETTDEIVVTKNGTQIGTLSPTNIEGLNATFTGTISGDADIDVDDVLTLTYHPVADFATQNGTLNGSATSAENFDMAVATLTISAITGNTITVSESQANFVNQTAVVVLSPYNSDWSESHSLNSLTVSVTMDIPEVGTVTEKIGPITVTGDQPHYFSLPSQSLLAEVLAAKYSVSASTFTTLLASATITFTGHQTDDDYDREYLTCSKTGYKFAAGKYYKLDNSNFSMTMLYKRAVADKDVYVSSSNTAWSNTVTYAVNSEIGWKVVGDYVFCGDKQLYVVDNSGPEPSEGWVKASDGHIPHGATYTLEDPAPVSLIVNPAVGQVIGDDGKNYADAAAATSAGATAVAMIVYVGSDNGEEAPYNHGLALALSDASTGCKWSTSSTKIHTYNTTSSSFESESGLYYNDATHDSDTYPAFKAAITYSPAAPTGCSAWFLASGYQWNKMIDACKNVLGTQNNYKDLRDGFSSVGGSNLQSYYYWSSTEKDSDNALDYYFGNGDCDPVHKLYDDVWVRACLAW